MEMKQWVAYYKFHLESNNRNTQVISITLPEDESDSYDATGLCGFCARLHATTTSFQFLKLKVKFKIGMPRIYVYDLSKADELFEYKLKK